MLHNRNMLGNGFREVIVTYFRMVQCSINLLILLFEPCNTESSFRRIFVRHQQCHVVTMQNTNEHYITQTFRLKISNTLY